MDLVGAWAIEDGQMTVRPLAEGIVLQGRGKGRGKGRGFHGLTTVLSAFPEYAGGVPGDGDDRPGVITPALGPA
ncbi:hypothetical protein GCM10008997_35640 [Halomonas salifodinae]